MKARKRVLVVGGAASVLLLAALAVVPLVFRAPIEARARAALDEAVDARVGFGDVGITLFRDFPNLSFTIRDLSITGEDAFEGDTLAHLPRFRLVIDLASAVRAYRGDEALLVRSVVLDRPYVHARVLEDGSASWDVLRTSDDAPTAAAAPEPGARSFRGALRRLEVNDARIVYEDEAAALHATIEGLDHTLSGDFASDRFALQAHAAIDRATVRQRGVAYLSGARVSMDADLDADMANRRFTLRDNRLRLNELGVGFDGSFALRDGAVDLDLRFAAERAELRDILSLVPALYARNFASLRASGGVRLEGRATGSYGPDEFPELALDLQVADGAFRYPDLPLPARNIQVALAVRNPGGDADSTVVRLSRLDVTIGEEPFSVRGSVATPISDPAVEIALDGRIDLADLSRTVEIDGLDALRGTVSTDAAVRTRLSDLEARRYERVAASGRVSVDGLHASGPDLPHPLEVEELRLELSPARAELGALRARLGSSDFRATGVLENPLAFALLGEPLRGRAALASDHLALDEWSSSDESEIESIPVPANLDLQLSANVARMTFRDLEMRDTRGTLRIHGERVTLDSLAMRTLDGEVVTTGWYETRDPARPTFDLQLAMREIDIPGAFAAFNTVRAFAPAAEYATGRFSADLRMNGAVGDAMMPVLEALNGGGAVHAAGAALRGMPALHGMADALHLELLRDPALQDFTASIEIRDGRLHVQPFDVRVGPVTMNVSGTNAIDRSIDYRVILELPRAALGRETDRVVASLASSVGRAGTELATAPTVRVAARVDGTMSRPTVRLDPGSAVAAGAAALRERVRHRADDAAVRAAEAREQATAEARARADALVAEAEGRAAAIVAEAGELAETVRLEANVRADQLVAGANGPIAQRAARAAGDRLRREADARADRIVEEARTRAEQVVADARARADALAPAADRPAADPPH